MHSNWWMANLSDHEGAIPMFWLSLLDSNILLDHQVWACGFPSRQDKWYIRQRNRSRELEPSSIVTACRDWHAKQEVRQWNRPKTPKFLPLSFQNTWMLRKTPSLKILKMKSTRKNHLTYFKQRLRREILGLGLVLGLVPSIRIRFYS